MVLSKYIPLRWKLKVSYALQSSNVVLPMEIHHPVVWIFLAADYGNLGDVAITYAQELYLRERYPNYKIIECPISKTITYLKAIKEQIGKDDIITIVGGGNMGDLYEDIEFLRQLIISNFCKNRIISFPQTLYFSSNNFKVQKRIARVYSKHSFLKLCARERDSYDKMQYLFLKAQIILCPDIVMGLRLPQFDEPRAGITFCLRKDKERLLNDDQEKELRTQLSILFTEMFDYDTHIGRSNLSIMEREQELNKIWAHFQRSEWVITDRLHGMIFGFITQTPTIVIPNNNNKINGCYEWIKDCGFVYMTNSYDINNILSTVKKYDMDSERVSKSFEKTFGEVRKILMANL